LAPSRWASPHRFHSPPFDSHDNDITYFFESQLPGKGAPVDDRHFHPVEPRTLRLTVETRF